MIAINCKIYSSAPDENNSTQIYKSKLILNKITIVSYIYPRSS